MCKFRQKRGHSFKKFFQMRYRNFISFYKKNLPDATHSLTNGPSLCSFLKPRKLILFKPKLRKGIPMPIACPIHVKTYSKPLAYDAVSQNHWTWWKWNICSKKSIPVFVRIIHYHSVKISGQNCNLLTSNTSIKCVIGEIETNKILALLCS